MLMGSEINVFDSQETKPYKNDSRVAAMNELLIAYQNDDVLRYEDVLGSNKDILEDHFIAENIDEVTRKMRMKAVHKLIAPYTRFTLAFIAKKLKISISEVQDIVGFLIVDQSLKGKINQETGIVEIESEADVRRTEALTQWANAVNILWRGVVDGEGFKAEDIGSAGTLVGAPLATGGEFGPPGPHRNSTFGSRPRGRPGKRAAK
jgi:COP9 signalosome complex subunit 2